MADRLSSLDYLLVRPGEPITAELWNRLVMEVRKRRLIKGAGTRVHSASFGQTVNLNSPTSFGHAFSVNVRYSNNAAWASVSPGRVNGQEPTTANNKKLSELPEGDPVTELSNINFDGNGNSFIALEVTLDDSYQSITEVKIVHCANLDRLSNTSRDQKNAWERGITGFKNAKGKPAGRFPLARVLKRGGEYITAQIAYWNLQHAAIPPVTAANSNIIVGAKARHFFWPVGGSAVSDITTVQ